ncbi:hypothetical protein [Botrimarina hoheduenensis]|uniref:Uncharacterized protein n=1 Tax=Botrimarina hoheduenensis TaxID=2528000 RepID=A0A5C5W940_9BACT|nr:hypothetical protein [Botrimarina hoheduenensis]TWT46793.1 hypothetical protein Pla111_18940 [Botrimarina hoheduenensis]
MDAFSFALAATPLAAYLLFVGLVNLRKRPLVVTGMADTGAVGAALSGVALIGPIALFRPEAATVAMGAAVWLVLLMLYWLGVALLTMLGRPRLVVYNATGAELRPALSEAARQLDPSARWAGDSLWLPTLGVQLHVDTYAWMRNTSLIATGGQQDLAGWRRLGKATERAARALQTTKRSHAVWLLTAGGVLLLVAIVALVLDPEGVQVAWQRATAI